MDNVINFLIIGFKEESFELVIIKILICMFVFVLFLIENIVVFVILKKNYGNWMRIVNSFFIVNMLIVDVFFVV